MKWERRKLRTDVSPVYIHRSPGCVYRVWKDTSRNWWVLEDSNVHKGIVYGADTLRECKAYVEGLVRDVVKGAP